MNKKLMFSSESVEYGTPSAVYKELNDIFNFNLDPCSTKKNHKCNEYYTKEDNGLSKDWGGKRVFMNPPYGRDIKHWIEKAYLESQKEDTLVVGLLPARTDTKYFHEFVWQKCSELVFVKGRLKFEVDGISGKPAPFPSMIVVWK